ncbi:MAG: recombinase family protein [Defluviitaleaceae bacterium]|nr:recombinase family protein [Defluviitaleaceae bacterium]
MARRKSVSVYEQANTASVNDVKRYRVGAYLRLSKEDSLTGTSASIDNQGKIIETFLGINPIEFELVETYVDDGLTGVTDDRAGFQRMIDDCTARRINCIIVKDGSRFARNYADCEYYVEEFFKIHNVRFICLDNPRVDSVKDPSSVSGMQFHFTNYFNEYFVKQTSEKILQTFADKRKRGEFIGAFAPFGYKKDPGNKNRLIIDEEAAVIVKKIFDLYVNEGRSMRQVCMELTGIGIPSLLQYQRANGQNIVPGNIPKEYTWNYNSIRKILKDERYCGHMIQGKSARISYKNKRHVAKPEEEWDVVYNTHEPIIEEELFQKAQMLLGRTTRVSPVGERSKYSGFLFCAKCGYALSCKRSNRSTKARGYVCKYYLMTRKCEALHTTEATLDERILYAIRSQVVLLSELEQVYNKILSVDKSVDNSKLLQTSLEKLQKHLQKLEVKSHRLYDSYDEGIISKELYASRAGALSEETESVNAKIDAVKKEARQSKQVKQNTTNYLNLFKKHENIHEVDRELLVALVDKILIENINDVPRLSNKSTKKVTVVFNFQDEYTALFRFINENKLVDF